MMKFAVLTILLLATCFAARADEVTIETILERVQALQSQTAAQDCSTLIEESHLKNSAQLFYSAAVCGKENRNADSSFLLLAGQIRSTTDMELYEPTSSKDKEAISSLYGLIFYYYGGTGDELIYRNPTQYNALMTRLAAWIPSRAESYNPGWRFKSPPKESVYQQAVASAKQHRFVQLETYSKLMMDEQYFAAQQELNELQSNNPRGFTSDTADGKRAMELLDIMQRREQEIANER